MALRAQRVEFVGNAFSLGRLEIGNYDFGSLATQTQSDGPADSLRPTGHNGHFPMQFHA
jgi:hypothetical protein